MLGFGSIASGSIADSPLVGGGTPSVNINLSGVSSAASVGTTTPATSVNINLFGVSSAASVGAIKPPGWMFVGTTTSTGDISVASPTIPAGTVAGDLLLLVVTAATGVTETSGGWTLVASNAVGLFVYTKTAIASTPQPTFTGTGIGCSVAIATYRDVASLDVAGATATITSTSLSTTSITTTADNDLVISIFGAGNTAGTFNPPFNVGLTTRANILPTAARGGLIIVDENKATAGAITTRAANSNAAKTMTSVALAFKQVVAAGSAVDVSLTGTTATGAVGTALPSQVVNPTLSGVSASGAVGTASIAIGRSLTGNSSTGSAGTTAITIGRSLTGNSSTGSAGTTAITIGRAVTGTTATGTVGTGAPSQVVTVTPSATSATGAVGIASPSQLISLGIFSTSSNTSVGTITPDSASTGAVNLSGVSSNGTAGTGTTSQAVGRTLSGVSSNGSAGTATGAVSANVTLSGVTGSVTIGTEIPQITISISGNSISGSVGSTGVLSAQGVSVTGVGSALTNARTNILPNSTMQGAIVGVVGSGGALPTTWNIGATTGISREVVGFGIDGNGENYIDIRIFGTNQLATIAYPDIYTLSTALLVYASPGMYLTASIKVSIIAGSRTGLLSPILKISVGGWNNGAYIESLAGNLIDGVRGSATKLLVGSGIRNTGMYIDNSIAAGSSVDVTYRITAPQLEYGSAPTAYIPTYGTSASAPPPIAIGINGSGNTSLTSLGDLSPSQAANVSLLGVGTTLISKRTNLVRNSVLQGAVIGTPGITPTDTGWGSSGGGMSRQIVGTGVDSVTGFNYVDIRWVGTVTATVTANMDSLPTLAARAGFGDTFTHSAYFALVGGSFPPGRNTWIGIVERNAAGTGLSFNITTLSTVVDATLVRVSKAHTCTNTSTAYIGAAIRGDYILGDVVDYTLRIAAPQLEYGPTATAYIPTYGTAASEPLPIAIRVSSTGNSASANTNNLFTTQTSNATLSGTSSAASVGSLGTSGASSATVNASGITSSVTTNNVTPSQAIGVTLTGTSANVTTNSETPSESIVVLVSGTSSNSSAGTVARSQVVGTSVSGNSTAGSAGTLTIGAVSTINVTVSGTSSNASVGTVTGTPTASATLSGITANGSVNTVTTGQVVTLSISGNSLAGSLGTLSTGAVFNVNISGVSANLTTNNEIPHIGIGVPNNTINGSVGTLSVSQTVGRTLTGTSSNITLGTILTGIGMSLSGNTAASAVGLLGKTIGIGILGNTITGIANILTGEPAKGVTITGVSLVSSTNDISVSGVDIDYSEIYRTATITYVTVEDSNIVVTMSSGDTFILQTSSDIFIQDSDSLVVVP